MKLFAVIYLKGQLALAMFLWPGATVDDCEKINVEFAATLPSAPGVMSGEMKVTDVRFACEWHAENPVRD